MILFPNRKTDKLLLLLLLLLKICSNFPMERQNLSHIFRMSANSLTLNRKKQARHQIDKELRTILGTRWKKSTIQVFKSVTVLHCILLFLCIYDELYCILVCGIFLGHLNLFTKWTV